MPDGTSVRRAGDGLEQVFGADMAHDCAARLRQVKNVALHLADHMHLAGLAIELQGQHLVTVHQLHRRHLGAHAGHALGLFRAQVEGEAQAVLGDHHRYFAGFLVGLVGRIDQLDAMAMVEQ